MSDMQMWTVYDHPLDYPNEYVARLWLSIPGQPDPVWTAHTVACVELERLREFMTECGLTRIPRSEGDDPVIIETWM